VRRAGVEPAARILRIDPAADLQSAWKRGERRARLRFIARTERDDVAAGQPVALVKFSEPACRFLRDKIRVRRRGIVTQCAADDLDDFAFVQIYAGPKHSRECNDGLRPPQFVCLRGRKFLIGMIPMLRQLIPSIAFAALAAGCHSPQTIRQSANQLLAARTNYPAHWWTPVPTNGAPAWEILPQAAAPGEVILSKRNELGLLSNFAPTPFTFRGKRYASLEGFWQMMKCPENADDPRAKFPGLTWTYTREQVSQMTAFTAKHAGDLADANMGAMGIGWVTFEGKQMEYRAAGQSDFYKLVVAATREKVRQNPDVEKVLFATGDLILKPDHHQETNAPLAWHYFEILTQIRAELQKNGKLRDN
jgi:hypothetical protein